jgi:hypothetical protein
LCQRLRGFEFTLAVPNGLGGQQPAIAAVAITRAMNRLRHAYLVMAPDLRPYFSTGHHDDERGIATTHLLGMGSELQT